MLPVQHFGVLEQTKHRQNLFQGPKMYGTHTGNKSLEPFLSYKCYNLLRRHYFKITSTVSTEMVALFMLLCV